MNEQEKQVLGLIGKHLQETAASDTIKTKNPNDQGSMDDDAPDNKKTGKDIKANKGAKTGAANTIKTKSTSKSDSESQDSEAKDNKETRKKIEKNADTKEVTYPGK